MGFVSLSRSRNRIRCFVCSEREIAFLEMNNNEENGVGVYPNLLELQKFDINFRERKREVNTTFSSYLVVSVTYVCLKFLIFQDILLKIYLFFFLKRKDFKILTT